MLIIVGLGNPGAQFKSTRHNVGFRFIDLMAKRFAIKLIDRRAKVVSGAGRIAGHEVVLAKPRTFMNNSGDGIDYLLARFQRKPTDLLVVYDEMALPLGRIRLRPSGSHAGHNGMRSIISSVRSEDFARLRIGVGKPNENGESIPHVLGRFSEQEEPLIAKVLQNASAAVLCMVENNIDIAMNRYNVIGI